MNNAEMREMFSDVMASLPQDMRLSKHDSNSIIDKFMNDVSGKMQTIVTSMVNKASEDGKLSSADRQKFTQELMHVVIPYIQSVADDEAFN